MDTDEANDTLRAYERTIIEATLASSRGEPYDEAAAKEATTILIAANLAMRGVSLDNVEKMMRDRDYTMKVKYDPATGDLTVDCVFDDEDDDDEF